ncbi:MAG: F0F1 ATP synthase subunit gamma [Silvanigrellales bacterium]|jgi:F-type H+-transporting ATPase subunit gamma|nr:F0F1 ATP synthase subunit gamma [Silvanigrellales bacterium]
MPANLKDLKGRIKSVKSTQQITKAMKLVSTAKLGRAQSNVVQARPYSQGLSHMAGRLLEVLGESGQHPLLQANESKAVTVVVLSSERGLCGGYNANVSKQALRTIEELESSGHTVHVVCIGKKAFQVLSRKWGKGLVPRLASLEDALDAPSTLGGDKGLTLITTPFDKPTYDMAFRLARGFEALFEEQTIGKLVLVFSRFQSALTQVPSSETVLPIEPPVKAMGATAVEPIFEPSVKALVEAVLPRYLANRLYQALLEAVASEHGARMSAMDNATRNAKDLERKLQITYQRARQAAITTELIEIISGAEAL